MTAMLQPGAQPEEDETVTALKEEIIAYAKGDLHEEGVLEFDDEVTVSMSTPPDGGAYVSCWHWVSFEDIGWAECSNCGEFGQEGDDWYNGECPSCADASEPEPEPEAQPWDDLKLAFGYDDASGLSQWWGLDGRCDGELPEGWELVETDSSGARHVAVFRVEGDFRQDDARAVQKIMNRFCDVPKEDS